MFYIFSRKKHEELKKKEEYLDEKEVELNKRDEEVKAKEENIAKIDEEREEYTGKINVLEGENTELKKEIQELKEKLIANDKEVKTFREEREIEVKKFKIMEKQMSILEKNLKYLHKNNTLLKEDEKTLKDSALDAILPIEKHRYKLPIEKYYSGTKFKEVSTLLSENKLEFLCEIDEDVLETIKINSTPKKYDEFLRKYNDYLNGELEIEMKIYALKGEKITKVYSKLRNFLVYADENSIEHMNDLVEFDFSELGNFGFKEDQISKVSERAKEYFERNFIEELGE